MDVLFFVLLYPLVYHPQGGWQYADMHQGVNGFKIIMNKSDLYHSLYYLIVLACDDSNVRYVLRTLLIFVASAKLSGARGWARDCLVNVGGSVATP